MPPMTRRDALKAAAGAVAVAGCKAARPQEGRAARRPDVVLRVERLGFPWQTRDPFLFCVHHDDHYPAGDERMSPAASLAGRQLGADFEGLDGWRMYHGRTIPGFPQHPHRGFETVTVVRRGLLDHSDSLGATARYGEGDVQWLTAGRGILHAEMFPLVHRDRENPLELFQIWLNLPRVDKMVAPHFSMFWRDTVPVAQVADEAGRRVTVTVVAGRFGAHMPPAPPPSSWAARPDTDVAIWTLRLDPHARWLLPAAPGTNRSLYFFRGRELGVSGRAVPSGYVSELRSDADAELENGPEEAEALLLQGRPIGETVARGGPFVMNTREEIREAYADFQRTQFGGWPWPSHDPVHPRDQGRFARLIDGRTERPA